MYVHQFYSKHHQAAWGRAIPFLQLFIAVDQVLIPSKLVYRHCQSAKWMVHNMLKLNCSKTQFMVVANPCALPQLPNILLRINNGIIAPSTTVRNLGVEFDSALKMNHHVSFFCRSLLFHLCNLGCIRPFINKSTYEKAVRAVVTSRLDYSNALLHRISSSAIKRLQPVRNRAAKLMCGKCDHATPLLHQLHWLLVHQPIAFKILTIVYKCLHNTAPAYLSSLIKVYHPGWPGLCSG